MIAAQVAHAAGAGSERHTSEVHVVVLGVRSEARLRSVFAELQAAGVAATLVQEVDPPYTGQAMSVGLELVRDRLAANRVLSSLPLLRETTAPLEDVSSASLEVCA